MDINIGKKLDGRYEILEAIGTGGMADVYRANDVVDGTEVAVKILKREFAENEEFLRRFRNESKAIALLSHPNIVRIIDVGFTNKIQFIVMEYIDGITLKQFMEQEKTLDYDNACYFTSQILKALQHAHDRGIVHRDIKPQNIMVLRDGTIKVMDFGIAKFAREEGLTTTAQAIGSVHYISPEQARSDLTDEKSDIYSVGIVLYEMLTGEKPFDNNNPVSVALMHMQTKAKNPREINPDIPRGLEEIILKAIEKEPKNRYSCALSMMDDIERFKQFPGETFGYYEEEDSFMDYDNNNNETNTKFFKALGPEKKNETLKKATVTQIQPDDDEPYYEEEYIEKRSMFVPILAGVVIVTVIIGVCFVFGLLYNYFGGGNSDNKEFDIQDYVGLNYEQVVAEHGNKINFVLADSDYSPDFEEGIIMSQNIPAGKTVKPHSELEVVVSKGPKMKKVTVVDSAFMAEHAIARLNEDGFEVQQKFAWSDDVKEGYVIETFPPANYEMKEGSTVMLIISRGPSVTEVSVPDLMGKEEAVAKEMLEDLDLVVEIAMTNSDQPEGRVVRQSLSANEKVKTGKVITIYISNGLPPTATQNIEVAFPANASGLFTFKVYVDGTLYKEEPNVDPAYTTRKTLSITASGTEKDITIILVNQNNGLEAELGRYQFSFDSSRTRKIISESIPEAFKSVDGIKANVTTVTTTSGAVTTTASSSESSQSETAPPETPAPTEPPVVSSEETPAPPVDPTVTEAPAENPGE